MKNKTRLTCIESITRDISNMAKEAACLESAISAFERLSKKEETSKSVLKCLVAQFYDMAKSAKNGDYDRDYKRASDRAIAAAAYRECAADLRLTIKQIFGSKR